MNGKETKSKIENFSLTNINIQDQALDNHSEFEKKAIVKPT